MSAMKRGLGRGLGVLIPTDPNEVFDPTAEEDKKESKLRDIEIDKIVRDSDQPRREFDDEQLNALAESIKENGVIQPIVVIEEGDKYKIVAGERRWRASKIAGLDKIPAIIRTLDAQKRMEIALIENVQRVDLNPIEIATVYAKFRDQFNLSNAEIAKRVGKSESAIINTSRLLNLPDSAKHAMVEHKLSEGQMRPLVTLKPEQIEEVLPKIINEGWSARKVEQYKVSLGKPKKADTEKPGSQATDENDELVEKIRSRLGVKASIKTSARGTGEIVLKFKNKEELEKICSILTA
ncbi:MAG: ParB/RepB/Spo0J family partition protein [Candidatus Saccharibacteria bacterium]|nr:ParB/RepB/Spo0J family partition protein [Candidatus Saccharibacteria bacterium]